MIPTSSISFCAEDAEADVQNVVRRIPQEFTFLSAITIGEIQRGIVCLPLGKRRSDLEAWFLQIQAIYTDAILPIQRETALLWGELSVQMQASGQNIKEPDLLIAATALEHDLTVVTRNVRDFAPTGVSLLDPWNPPADLSPAGATKP
ncbi:MAG: type II toxin-antitoxin system VapC family toxin [Thermomicrobiales bacterium]